MKKINIYILGILLTLFSSCESDIEMIQIQEGIPSEVESNIDESTIISIIKEKHYNESLNITHKALQITGQKLISHGLNWSLCEEMSEHRISFGSHTLSHPRLSLLSPGCLENELLLSKLQIENRGLNYVNAIC